MYPITQVTSNRAFDKQLERVPSNIRKKVMLWVFLVESSGVFEVMKTKGFHDEPLRGNRQGERSVRINSAYRVIYRVILDRVHIELLEVHKHDY